MTYRYETHLHTSPVSACARSTPEEAVRYYHSIGYAGIFITNHFLDGNIAFEVRDLPFEERLDFYYRAYTQAKRIGDEIGIDVFFGVELAYKGTDFLVYGLDIEWYQSHPEILEMKKSEELALMREAGALVVHAHPFREAKYIDHIRLFPRAVDGIEVTNASRTPFENKLAGMYCEEYGLIPFAGSDNHNVAKQRHLAGMESKRRAKSLEDFIAMVRSGELVPFITDIADEA